MWIYYFFFFHLLQLLLLKIFVIWDKNILIKVNSVFGVYLNGKGLMPRRKKNSPRRSMGQNFLFYLFLFSTLEWMMWNIKSPLLISIKVQFGNLSFMPLFSRKYFVTKWDHQCFKVAKLIIKVKLLQNSKQNVVTYKSIFLTTSVGK